LSNIKKFSKPSNDLAMKFADFLTNNDSALNSVLEVNEKYRAMATREYCKICKSLISRDVRLLSFNINYFLCTTCGHLNGEFEDEGEFAQYLYSENSGANYSENYSKDYHERVQNIYVPKANFLVESLKQISDVSPQSLSILDVGAGAGHFLKALEDLGVDAKGVEVNEVLVSNSANFLIQSKVEKIHPNMVLEIIKLADAIVISLIGTLEHLEDPMAAVEAFNESNAQYLYLSVPMVSFTALLQGLNESIYPRHLSAGHTHLFSEKSIDYLKDKYQLKSVAEWWFGTDLLDLARTLTAIKNKEGTLKNHPLFVNNYISTILDELQGVLDRNKLCSELHIILSKN